MKFFIVLLFVAYIFAQQPENVFIISIDGLRNDEGFESESLYLRHIWNDLRPFGTIYTRFWNLGYTVTTAGHTTIFSGVYQYLPNNSSMEASVRIKEPCLSEYYRKYFSFPEISTGCVVGKSENLEDMHYGLDPSYGEPYKGFMVLGGADTITARLMDSVLTFHHPSLVLYNLPSVDATGHTGDTAQYLGAIVRADSIVYELYRRIQAIPPYTDTFYKNKTVLMITTDHGRHDNAHGGWQAHGGWDHGSKHIPFLAIGPGIRQNTVLTTNRNHIDIAPTVGYILGFPTPLAEGNVMTEMFLPTFRPHKPRIARSALPLSHEWNLSNSASFSRDPDLAIDNAGKLHIVWSDNNQNYWKIFYRQSTDYGLTWQPTRTLFNFPQDSLMMTAKISARDSIIVSAIGIAKVRCEIDTLTHAIDTSFVWRVWTAVSADGGNTFKNYCIGHLDSSMMILPSPATAGNNRFSVTYSSRGGGGFPPNGLLFNFRNQGGAWRDTSIYVSGPALGALTICDNSKAFHIVAFGRRFSNWNLSYWKIIDETTWTRRWLTNDDSVTGYYYDYDPHIIATDTNNLYLVWAIKPDLAGTWQIYFKRSTNNGDTWSTMTQISSSPVGAWNPKIAARHDTLFVVWEDYREDEPKIYYRISPDLGLTWLPEEPIAGAIARNPSITIDNNRFYLAWQDYRDGNWEVYFKYLPFSLPRHDVGPAHLVKPQTRTLPDDSIMPQAMIRNYGDVFETFKTFLWIEPAYFDTTVVTVAPEDSIIATFSQPWNATFGSYPFKLYTTLNTDQNLTNDTITSIIEVIGDSWIQIEDVPLGPRNRKVKAGGSLVYVPDQNLIYALKGNNTNEFYAYSLSTGNWLVKESMPYDPNGRSKRVKRGGALCYDGSRYIYATKGKNTTEFWRYDTKSDIDDTIWKMLPSVPLLPSGKKVKGGTGLVFVTKGSNQYLYLLKGSKTTDFYAYHIQADSWLLGLPQAPLGTSAKPFKYGSCMIQVENNLYALKSYYNEFYRYDLIADTWEETQISVMPFYSRSGRRKKVKDGAALCYDGVNIIYAFKGGNTQEFWTYLINQDTWIQRADLPREPSRKKVKSGGALAFVQGRVYGLKGNNNFEFWVYAPGPVNLAKSAIDKLVSFSQPNQSLNTPFLKIGTNPCNGILRINYSLPNLPNGQLKVFDISGKLRYRFKLTSNQGPLDLPMFKLNSGVYFLQIESDKYCFNQKFVLKR